MHPVMDRSKKKIYWLERNHMTSPASKRATREQHARVMPVLWAGVFVSPQV